MRVLILAPHTDDGEFGCGGTVHRLIREGHNVHYVALSAAETSLSAQWSPNTLRDEVIQATRILGVQVGCVQVKDFPVRNFPSFRQAILEVLVALQGSLQPDMVFIPSTDDTHQDHQVVSHEGFRAFKRTTLVGYELPWNNLTFKASFFVRLSPEDVGRKVEAIHAYRSQADHLYTTEDFLRGLARVRGVQIGAGYAEAFEVLRWII